VTTLIYRTAVSKRDLVSYALIDDKRNEAGKARLCLGSDESTALARPAPGPNGLTTPAHL
jgi:hypothetical protein